MTGTWRGHGHLPVVHVVLRVQHGLFGVFELLDQLLHSALLAHDFTVDRPGSEVGHEALLEVVLQLAHREAPLQVREALLQPRVLRLPRVTLNTRLQTAPVHTPRGPLAVHTPRKGTQGDTKAPVHTRAQAQHARTRVGYTPLPYARLECTRVGAYRRGRALHAGVIDEGVIDEGVIGEGVIDEGVHYTPYTRRSSPHKPA